MPVHMLMQPQMVRQGDVLIIPVSAPVDPADVGELIREGEGKRIVLAHGEVTGHAHAFYPDQDVAEQLVTPVEHPVRLHALHNVGQYAPTTLLEGRLLRLSTRALLRHEEHDHISLPPGDYVVLHQVEYDDAEELRRVAD